LKKMLLIMIFISWWWRGIYVWCWMERDNLR
jgi:hypothetical protein